MIQRIDHIGVAVNSIEEAMKVYRNLPGLEVAHDEIMAEEKVRIAMIPVGESRIELLESTDPAGIIANYIERRGEGIHHLALEVNDIEQTLETLKENGIPLIDEKPRKGAGGSLVAFLHPRGTKILLELVQH